MNSSCSSIVAALIGPMINRLKSIVYLQLILKTTDESIFSSNDEQREYEAIQFSSVKILLFTMSVARLDISNSAITMHCCGTSANDKLQKSVAQSQNNNPDLFVTLQD